MTITLDIRALAALAMVVLLGVGCSNAPASNGSSSAKTATNRAQGMTFSQCMRDNGASAFPDPDASGSLTIDQIANGTSLDTDSAAFKQAFSACKDLEPPGFTGYRRTAEQQKAALKFAQCMRDNGVNDFPDPTPDAPLIDTTKIPSLAGKEPRNDPGLKAAMEKCRNMSAASGVRGP